MFWRKKCRFKVKMLNFAFLTFINLAKMSLIFIVICYTIIVYDIMGKFANYIFEWRIIYVDCSLCGSEISGSIKN